MLTARRLVEAGVPIVQATMGIVQTWDTHVANFPRLKDELLPPLDRAVSALLDDLEVRGLLDETLVVMLGEFGRTPRIAPLKPGDVPGRDHWPFVFPGMVLALTGLALGYVGSNIAILADVRPGEEGVAGALVNTSFQLGATVGIASTSFLCPI